MSIISRKKKVLTEVAWMDGMTLKWNVYFNGLTGNTKSSAFDLEGDY